MNKPNKNQTVKYIPLASAVKNYYYHPKTFLRWIKKGQIKGKKQAGKWYVEKESLEQKIKLLKLTGEFSH